MTHVTDTPFLEHVDVSQPEQICMQLKIRRLKDGCYNTKRTGNTPDIRPKIQVFGPISSCVCMPSLPLSGTHHFLCLDPSLPVSGTHHFLCLKPLTSCV